MGDNHVLPARVQNVLDMEIIRLNLWSIKFNASNIKLEGYVRSEDGCSMQKVCSEIICKRMNATMLFDVSGRFFELAGQIDREFQLKMGMPSRVIDEFVNGFPENWGFLINSCLTMNQMSVPRPIQAAPREPLRSRNEPIVTLADETELADSGRKTSESERDKKRREREEQRMKENEKRLETEKEKERQKAQAAAAAEKKRQEEEEDAANYTLRGFQMESGDPITPIRFKRGQANGVHAKPTFVQTPVRGKPSGPLASSTPQAPLPEHPRRSLDLGKRSTPLASPSPKVQQPVSKPARETEYASDSELFAVPKLPAPKAARPSATSSAPSDTAFDFLDDMDVFFDTAVIDQTPVRARKQPRRVSPDVRRDRSSSRDPERFGDYDSTRNNQRYNNDYDMSRMSRRDATFRRNDERRDDSRMNRKRGYYNSPDDYDNRRSDYYESDSRYDTKRSRHRETSSSSGRSVRFQDDHRRSENDDYRRREGFRDPEYQRNYRDFEERRVRGSSGDEDKKKLNDILRREKELMARLQNNQKPSSSRRVSCSSDDDIDMADEWDRENQEIMDNSMMFGDGISKQKRRSGGSRQEKKKQPTRTVQPKPKRVASKKKSPVPSDDLNDSIASNRPRRACVTPSTPAPKRITWPKRDLDKLQHVIDLKKPSAEDADWVEVTRLLAKEGVESEVVKQIAISRLKWKEPVKNKNNEKKEEEEDETRRRRGAVARVKEGVRMHEELIRGRDDEERDVQVESMEDYQPEDVAADQSLLALGTPLAAKKKGGTRGSIMPKPVEDSPMARRQNSSFNSPRLDQTKAKEMETTLRYVQQISMMQARPSSRANKSKLNKTSARGSKNNSMSVEQGTRKALKIINRGRTIHEESEEEEEESDDDEFDEREEGDNSIY